MLVLPGDQGGVTCDGGLTRRELLRVGGSSLIGLNLAQMLELQQASAEDPHTSAGGPGSVSYTHLRAHET